jgi:hypothetical protein
MNYLNQVYSDNLNLLSQIINTLQKIHKFVYKIIEKCIKSSQMPTQHQNFSTTDTGVTLGLAVT